MTLDELRALATVPVEGGFTTWPDPYGQMCVTLEDAELLYAIVRAVKPKRVLELGTGLGISGRFIAEALKANTDSGGWLISIEPDDALRRKAEELLIDWPVSLHSANADVNALTYEIVYIDSDSSRRERDIENWLTSDFKGLVLVHDAGRAYPGLRFGTGTVVPSSQGLWIGRAGRA